MSLPTPTNSPIILITPFINCLINGRPFSKQVIADVNGCVII